MFTERKIEKFQQTISGLPDTPNLSAAELKRRFDACPEELRQALNGVCDDGAALEKRMDAYRAETFEGEITRSMLAPAVREELGGKADAGTNDAAHEAFSAQIAKKCEVYFGTYTGDGEANRVIELGFRPVAAIILCEESFFALKTQTYTCVQNTDVTTTASAMAENGLHVGTTEKDSRYPSSNTNAKGKTYEYIAFKA